MPPCPVRDCTCTRACVGQAKLRSFKKKLARVHDLSVSCARCGQVTSARHNDRAGSSFLQRCAPFFFLVSSPLCTATARPRRVVEIAGDVFVDRSGGPGRALFGEELACVPVTGRHCSRFHSIRCPSGLRKATPSPSMHGPSNPSCPGDETNPFSCC